MISRSGQDQSLPFSEDGEKGVLCSLWRAPSEVAKQCDENHVTRDSFYIPSHVILYETIRRWPDPDTPVDFTWLKNELGNQLEECGGAESVNELYDFVPTHKGAQHYIEIVLEKSALRRTILVCKDVQEKCLEGEIPAKTLVGDGVTQFSNIAGSLNGEIVWPPSPNSTKGYKEHKAIYPKDSILEDYMVFSRNECEASDAYLIGSILPVVAAQLERRVYFPWGQSSFYPNIFSMLVGPPGDRKSSAMKIPEKVARTCLPDNAFLPGNFSPEALFDLYEEHPDKIWIQDDANIVLTDWRKSTNGERNAPRFLTLYDCCPLTESFRGNKSRNHPEAKRSVPETSTSVAFGATPNVARFQDQAQRQGLARRFLNYVSEGHGRFIPIPGTQSIGPLLTSFRRLNEFSGKMSFTAESAILWTSIQSDNRERLDELGSSDEEQSARLSSSPAQILKIAMIFQACVLRQAGLAIVVHIRRRPESRHAAR